MASTLMFWNKQNSNSNQNGNDAKNTKNGRNWLHAPDVLVNGHVAYLVKYLGSTPVEQPKGIEVVKEAIRRLQFTQQMKKAEGGGNVKTKKVEITISVDGVAIQEPRSLTIMHQFPLHKISYCADEKGVKKFFSFIAKTGTGATPTSSIASSGDDTNSSNNSTTSNGTEDRHECFVFISNKLASDITLTIGQAFDLAYRRYVSDSGKSLESVKLLAQKKQLEHTIAAYRQRLRDLSELVSKSDLDKLLLKMGIRDICDVPALENGVDGHNNYTSNNNNINSNNHNVNGTKTPDLGIDVSLPNNDDQLLIETSPKHFAPIVPPRNGIQNQINNTLEAFKPSVGTKLEGLLLNSDSDSDFDPRAPDTDTSISTGGGNKISNDLFGFEPPKPTSATLGQQLFGSVTNNGHNNGFTNGNGAVTNGFGAPNSPPPMLAPPPAKSAPRRTVPQTNGTTNGTSAYQDLFGSAPFNPQGNDDSQTAALEDSSSFANSSASTQSGFGPFSQEVNVLSKNSYHLDSILAYGDGCNGASALQGSTTTTTTTSSTGTTAANLASKLNPFAAAIRSNPLAAVQHKAAAYDVFKNATGDKERLTTNTGTVTHSASFDAADECEVTHSANKTAPAALASDSTGTTNPNSSVIACTSGQAHELAGASEALFEDFALSAFNEFKRDLSANSRNVKRQSSLLQDRSLHKPSLGSLKSIGGGSVVDANSGGARLRRAGGPALLQPEMKTTKNGFFSSDDVLDTFDPLKK
ncbi:PTB domain-containing adapter protein ced-6 [Anopheles gambiae]|uniref:PTB domain-containing adapter protein ced-6 n=1 Tax=Anopheles gambiae TaxID=7165 RepID=UPI002AC92B6B|nr:PTB domain-containing adapter protein ced-6 [Anopheles gambiae]XP_061502778.1 PTB domain-containing adapter protein ced-6 [Anopheles gambiae]XP_061502779.1 PTB domain-containing adapter protein ced-6 [Anopheles gambiae]